MYADLLCYMHVHLHSCDDITGRIESCIILLSSQVTHTDSTIKAVNLVIAI